MDNNLDKKKQQQKTEGTKWIDEYEAQKRIVQL